MADKLTVDLLVDKYVTGGKQAVDTALKEVGADSPANLTLSDIKMDSLDVVQLAVKVQDELGIQLSDDEFTKVPEPGKSGVFKPVNKVTLGDITNIINSKLS